MTVAVRIAAEIILRFYAALSKKISGIQPAGVGFRVDKDKCSALKFFDGPDRAVFVNDNFGVIKNFAVYLRSCQKFDAKFFLIENIGGGTDKGYIQLARFEQNIDLIVGCTMDHFRWHTKLAPQILDYPLVVF